MNAVDSRFLLATQYILIANADQNKATASCILTDFETFD